MNGVCRRMLGREWRRWKSPRASLLQNQPKQGLERLSLGLSRKEVLQAGHSQASPAGPSALTPPPAPAGVSGHTSLGSLGLQHRQQLWQRRWPDVRFDQQQGREEGMEMPGEGEVN